MKTTNTTESFLSQIPHGFKLFAKEELAKEIRQLNPSFRLDPDNIYVNVQGTTIPSETLTDALLKKVFNKTNLLSVSLSRLYTHPESIHIKDQVKELHITDVESTINRLSATLVNTYREQEDTFWKSEKISIPQELRSHATAEFLKNLAENISLVEKVYQIDTSYPNLKQAVIVHFSKKLQGLYNKDIHPDTVHVFFFRKKGENRHLPFLSFNLTDFALDHFSSWLSPIYSSNKTNIQVKVDQNSQNLQLDRIFQESDIIAIKANYQAKLSSFLQKNYAVYRNLVKFSYFRALFEQPNSTFALSKESVELACRATLGFSQKEIDALEIDPQEISLNTLKALIPTDFFEASKLVPKQIKVSHFCINNQTATDILKIHNLETNDLLLFVPGYIPSFIEAKNEQDLIDWVFNQTKSSSANLTSIALHFPHASRMANTLKLDAFLYQDHIAQEKDIAKEAIQEDIFYSITKKQFARILADLNADDLPSPLHFSSTPNYRSTDFAFFTTIAAATEYAPHLLPNIHATSTNLQGVFPTPSQTASELIKKGIKQKRNLDIDPDTTFIRFSFFKLDPSLHYPAAPYLDRGIETKNIVESLTAAALNNYQTAPSDCIITIYRDPSGKGVYKSDDQLLDIPPQDIKEIIQEADLSAIHKNRLNNFWDAHTNRVKYFIKHRYLQQALEAYHNKVLSEESLRIVSDAAFYALALEEGELPSLINPSIRIEILNIAGYQSTDIFMFHTKHQEVVLYIAGNKEAFLTFTSRGECLCFLEEKTRDMTWQKLLASHFSLDIRDEIMRKLDENSHTPTIPLIYENTSQVVGCMFKNPSNRPLVTIKPIKESFFEVMQKNIQERSYLDANVLITSDRELILKRLIHVAKFIEIALLVPSIAFPILNWATLAVLTTEIALDLYLIKNGDTVHERYQAARDAGMNIVGSLLSAAFIGLRSLKLSKYTVQGSRKLPTLTRGGSGLSAALRKSPVSEEVFFGTTKSMQVWNIGTSTPRFAVDVKAWFLDEQFLLFTGKTNKADHLIISSHGGYFPGSGIVPVPENTELIVLGPHGWELIDPKISNIAKKTVLPYAVINENAALPTQTAFNPNLFSNIPPNTHVYPKPTDIKALAGTKTPGHIKNYTLSKYQTFKPNQESYLDIVHTVNRSRNTFPIIHELGIKPVDILTVRNRYSKIIDPSLENLFQALQNQEIHYKRITLAFCRSNALLSAIELAPEYVPPTLF